MTSDSAVPETAWSPEEIEAQRQDYLREAGEAHGGDPVPGSFGCHEALHMTSFLTSAIDAELCQHRAILMNPAWFKVALEAQQKLADLYQAIGAAHLSAEDPDAALFPEGTGRTEDADTHG